MTQEDQIELTAHIVAAYVSENKMPQSGIASLIESVHAALSALAAPAPEVPAVLTPAVNPKRSVFPDRIISLEDGKSYKTLKRHLTGRGLTPDQYREKWRLPASYPMVAPDYAARRSELAKSRGLGRKASKPASKRRKRS